MTVEEVKAAIELGVPGAAVAVVVNASPSAQHSLLLDAEHALDVARFLRDDAAFRLDFCSNVTGVDWPDTEVVEKMKVTHLVDGLEQLVEETRKTLVPGYLEVVYHLFSIEKKHGPIILRMRTADRGERVHLPSLTPVWRSAEFQEREIFDLYGVVFDGHPDLRRILMWEELTDHPMRKDYVPPADEELEMLEVARS